jgi:hypothetical protein
VSLTTRAARATADRQAVTTIRSAVSQFQKDVGILPPLVRDRATTRAWVEPGSGGTQKIAVYPAQSAALRTPTELATALNPLRDNRYSESSLAFFLVGTLERPLSGASGVPIDGVPGPGYYKPRVDGTFEIPVDVRNSATAPTQRTASVLPSLLDTGRRSPKLATDVNASPDAVQLVDSSNVAFRYYRWLPGREVPPGSGNFVVERVADLNIPPMVGRDLSLAQFAGYRSTPEFDITKNLQLRDATFAIVSAGENGVFGDEDLAVLNAALGSGTEADLRIRAESDNAVEVGS